MLACLDVHYFGAKANAAALTFDEWTATAARAHFTASVPEAAVYQSGKFYLRELHPLLAVIEKIPQTIDCFVIDGYCYLSPEHAPGLGAMLYEALGSGAPIIGVAKSRYGETSHAFELRRAKSARPLFITAIGMSYADAAGCIALMAGGSRIPDLLKEVDRVARSGVGSPS